MRTRQGTLVASPVALLFITSFNPLDISLVDNLCTLVSNFFGHGKRSGFVLSVDSDVGLTCGN